MTTYNTGNPVGSVDVRDLYDNAQNLDNFSNGTADKYADRFGVSRQSLQGIRNASQYQVLGAYAAGLVFTSQNQVFSYIGEFYAPGPSITLPYTTTGAGAPEIAKFRSVGDAVLRSDLAINNNVAKGAALVGFRLRTVHSRLDDDVHVGDYDTTGGADWTAAFTAASAAANARGCRVFVPATLAAYNLGNVTLTASFYTDGAVLSRKAGTTGTWVTLGANNISLRGFTMAGNWIGARCIEVQSVANCTIEDNIFKEIGNWCVHFNGSDRLTIRGNRVISASQGFSNVMPVDSAEELQSHSLDISYNTMQDLAGTGIYLAGEQSTGDSNYFKTHLLVTDAVIHGNRLRNVAGHGIIGQARSLTISDNTLRNCGNAAGIQSIVPQGVMVTVTGNTVEGGSGVGIDMGFVSSGTVSGNSISGCGQIGIEANSCIGVSITGNSLNNCGALEAGVSSSGISILEGFFGPANGSFGVTVTGNIVRNSGAGGRYGISIGAGVTNVIVTANHIALSGTVAPFYIDATAQALVFGNIEGDNEEGLLINRSSSVVAKQVTRGPTGNNDLWLSPTGTGTLRLDKNFGTAATPANFSAQSYIQLKDLTGNIFYVPAKTAAW